jgi:hypothetical protein
MSQYNSPPGYEQSSGYGQSPGFVVPEQPDVVASTTVVTPRDSVRWGPVFAGLLTALGTFLLLSTLALAVGLQVAPSGSDADDAGIAAGIVTAVIGLVSFFLGGLIAARSAAVGGSLTGALNGFLVWALGMAFVVILAALGVGQLFGAAGDLFDQYRSLGSPAPDVDIGDLRDSVRDGALGAFLGLALPALAAAAGGWLGARTEGMVRTSGSADLRA